MAGFIGLGSLLNNGLISSLDNDALSDRKREEIRTSVLTHIDKLITSLQTLIGFNPRQKVKQDAENLLKTLREMYSNIGNNFLEVGEFSDEEEGLLRAAGEFIS